MEPVPSEVMGGSGSPSGAGAVVEPRVSSRDSDPGVLGIPARLRLALQHQAPAIVRRHVLRWLARFAGLVAADLGTFAVLREFVRSVRDYEVFGAGLAAWAQGVLPGGHLNGWKYAAALFIGLLVTGNYGTGDRRRDAGRIFAGVALATALPMWDGLWHRGWWAVLVQYGLTVASVGVALVVARYGLDAVIERARGAAEAAADALFVGPAEECRRAMRGAAFGAASDYRRVGFVDVAQPPGEGALGHLSNFPALLAASGADAVVLCGKVEEADLRAVVDVALAAGCQVLTMPRVIGMPGVQAAIVWRHGQPIVELTAPTLRGWQLAVKRTMDLLGSAFGLMLLAPLFAAVAVLIKRDSPGPVFFTQRRVGQGGWPFKIIKFRTMAADAEARRAELSGRSVYTDGRLFKMKDDPRITRVGRWLRRTSIDELPQLVNVFMGHMSLVGPRPPLPSEVDLYERHHYARFDVKPGMTGPWQVGGRNEITDFERVVAMETEYIRDWSLARDVAILFRTIPVILGRRGAH